MKTFFALPLVLLLIMGLPAFAQYDAYAPENDQALALANNGEFEKALLIWQPLAQSGDARAQSNMGLLHEKGQAVAQNYETAVDWFRLSANQGFEVGQFNLATMYKDGTGVALDNVAAHGWYLTAARQGYTPSQMALVGIYYTGTGTPENPARAYMWMYLAAQGGETIAIENLSDFESRIDKNDVLRGREWAAECLSSEYLNCG